jgi:hypothetical protein
VHDGGDGDGPREFQDRLGKVGVSVLSLQQVISVAESTFTKPDDRTPVHAGSLGSEHLRSSSSSSSSPPLVSTLHGLRTEICSLREALDTVCVLLSCICVVIQIVQWSLDYPQSLGDINPNLVKIESADNQDNLLPNYSIIDFWGDMD